MAEKTFQLEVITPDRVVLSDDQIVSVVAPGSEGYLGMLANHAPLMTELTIGKLDFRRADGTTGAMAISGGFLEVFENKVSVLAESAELVEEIDVERAEQAKKRAEERLAAAGPDVDAARAQAALERAINRLHTARRA
jgi:F-type H+-transporting ATPase subunit epsilon